MSQGPRIEGTLITIVNRRARQLHAEPSIRIHVFEIVGLGVPNRPQCDEPKSSATQCLVTAANPVVFEMAQRCQ
jgi:hypothetical protein